MITDEQLERMLHDAGDAIDVPEHGPDAVRAALREVPVRHAPRRAIVLSAAAVVAFGALAAGIALAPGGSHRAPTATAGVGQSSKISTRMAVGDAAAEAPPQATGPTTYTYDNAKAASGGSGGLPVAAPVAPAAGGSAPGPAVGGPSLPAVQPRVVKTGSADLTATHGQVQPTLSRLQALANSNGGYVSSSSSDLSGKFQSGSVTMRIDADRFDAVLGKLTALSAQAGGDVQNVSTRAVDVTAEYTDIGARLHALESTRATYLTILSRATTIGETLSVQQQIDGVQQQIEQLQGQQRLLANQSDLASLTVTVSEKGAAPKPEPKPLTGAGKALHRASSGFTGALESVVAGSGVAAVILIALALLAVVGRFAFRLARRRLV